MTKKFTKLAAATSFSVALSTIGTSHAQESLVVYDFEFGVDYSGYSPVGYEDECVDASHLFNSDNETLIQGWRCFQNWGTINFDVDFDANASGSLSELSFDYSQYFESTSANPITEMTLILNDGFADWNVGTVNLDPDLRSVSSYGDNSANLSFDLSGYAITGGESLSFTFYGQDETPFVNDFNGVLMDNIILSGSVDCIPEPGSVLLAGIASLTLLRRRRSC